MNAMNKIWDINNWPKPIFLQQPLLPFLEKCSFTLDLYPFQHKIMMYLLSICKNKQISVQVMQMTLSLASRYLKKNQKYNEPIQQIILVSLYLSGKVLGNSHDEQGEITIHQCHRLSNHSFTSRDIFNMERKILQSVEYDILSNGICDRKVKATLQMIRNIVTSKCYTILKKVTEDLQIVLWAHIYQKGNMDRIIRRTQKQEQNSGRDEDLFVAAIIQTAFVLSTHCMGRFPATVWMALIFQLKEDELGLCVQKILKIVLGKKKFEQLKI